jgi:AcrR family transcriptional regulator
MNDRKLHVIKIAHQLFIEKGFQTTSIQDILDYSGISKGTFYNYFSSKNELLMAIFKTLHENLEKERNKLLIGQDRSDIEIFIKQIELQMKINKQNKLFGLFEEVFVSNDVDLKDFLKQAQAMQISWTFHRLVDIFGESKKPYLLDCTIMFTGMLHHYFHYLFVQKQTSLTIYQVICYCIDRLTKMVEEVASTGDQLFEPELLDKWFPTCTKDQHNVRSEIVQSILELKKLIHNEIQEDEQKKLVELLDFMQEELLQAKPPRRFLIQSALDSLHVGQVSPLVKQLEPFKQLVHSYMTQI